MYIEPTSTIKILHNVPLDETYEHTIYFSKPEQGYHDQTGLTYQYNYFASLTKFNLTNQMYQRVQRGYIRVHINAEKLYDCNYLMFQNTGFSYTEGGITYPAKWFYAFIKSVEYINNEVSEIQFSLDVMQTWMFDYQLKPSFVIREHSATDQIGDHIQEESIGTGELVFTKNAVIPYFAKNDLRIVVAATFKEDSGALVDAVGGLYGGLYTGLYFNVFSSANDVNDFLLQVTNENKADGIISIFMWPRFFAVAADGSPQGPPSNTYTIPKNTAWTYTWEGRTGPRNKKLYCYPYNYLLVKCSDGTVAPYKWEFFDDTPTFWFYGAMNPAGQIAMVPMKYNMSGYSSDLNTQLNYHEMTVLNSIPQCAFSIDSYRAWIAQITGGIGTWRGDTSVMELEGGNPFAKMMMTPEAYYFKGTALQASQQVINGLGNTARGNNANQFETGSNALGIYQTVRNSLLEWRRHYTLPPHLQGMNTNVLDIGLNNFGFVTYNARVRPEYAAMIDGYFDKYGYIVNKIKKPNIHVRENWTYTRTAGCVIDGSVPADDAEKICSIFDNGVTHWARGAAVGDYLTASNRCLSEIT